MKTVLAILLALYIARKVWKAYQRRKLIHELAHRVAADMVFGRRL